MKQFTTVKDVDDVMGLVVLARQLKSDPFSNKDLGKNKTLGLLFFNPSLRTRLSTQKAAQNLGMDVMVLNVNGDSWAIEMHDGIVMDAGSQEHIKEAAGVISQYCDIIGIRTFPSLKDKREDYSEYILKKFLQNATVPVVSLESATLHPLQSLADLLTISESKIVKPKIAITWAPHPKALPQAVVNSFCEWIGQTEADVILTHPKGFELSDVYTSNITICYDQNEALKGADFVYAKNWSSYNDYGQIGCGLNNWAITKAKMELTNNGKFMHCLPLRRNVVATDEVLDSSQSIVLEQANNRTFAAQAVLYKMLCHE